MQKTRNIVTLYILLFSLFLVFMQVIKDDWIYGYWEIVNKKVEFFAEIFYSFFLTTPIW